MLKFVRLTDKAYAPIKASKHAAGYDLRRYVLLKLVFRNSVLHFLFNSAYEYVIEAHGKELIKTDLQIEVPEGTYGRVAPRSGLAWNHFIDVGAGVIDADYR